jgi:maleamate amidohydrolase
MLEGDTDEIYAKRQFGTAAGPGAKPAVIVIDFQLSLTEPGWPLYGGHDKAIAATAQLLQSARAAGVPVIHTVVGYSAAELALDCYGILRKIPPMRGLELGTRACEIDPRVAPAANEPVIVKKAQSAFIGTPLAQMLLGLGVDTLLFSGCNTSGCVRGTVMDASARGYRIMLVEETLSDVTQQVHDTSMYDMSAKNGDVMDLTQAGDYLADIAGYLASAPALAVSA